MGTYQETLVKFWSHHPGLLYGLSALFGTTLALYDFNYLFVLLFVLLFISPVFFSLIPEFSGLRLRAGLALILGCAAFFFAKVEHRLPDAQNTDLMGTAYFRLSALSDSKTPFGAIWSCKGVLQSFISDGGEELVRNIPIRITIPSGKDTERPVATHSYRARARLRDSGQGGYSLSIVKKIPWVPLEKTWSLAEWRYGAKKYARKHIHDIIKDPHAAAFLAGIATGEFDDRILSFELGRFGLQHLMAISGLHFAILTSIIGFILKLIFPSKTSALILIAVLSAYFIFLGPSPSVVRAWIAIMIALCGVLLGKSGIALNSLGIAVLVMALCDPLVVSNIGFQFSFAVTAAILVWFSPCDVLCQKIFAKRRLSELVLMGSLDQHGYCVLFFLRQALALGLAVNLVALPLTLYHFHKFPMMSLIYNVFFPLLMSVCMLLLIAAILVSFVVPYAGSMLHSLNESFTQFLLNFAFNLPKSFDIAIRIAEFSHVILLIYLLLIFLGGILVRKMMEKNKESLLCT